jgi:cell division protein FtsQ
MKKSNRYRTDWSNFKATLLLWCKVTVGFVLSIVSILVLSAVLAYSYHALLEAPWLGVQEIQITGLKHVARREILNALGVPRGANILTLKTSLLTDRLQTIPWVRSCAVRLDPPSRVAVEVMERKPLAIVHANDFFLLDEEGKLFVRVNKEDKPGEFLVAGLSGMTFKEGDFLPPRPLEELKRLLSALEKSKNWLPLDKIAQCTWDVNQGFCFQTAENSITIRLGFENLDRKLERLHRILAVLAERQLSDLTSHIDLDYPNRAFVGGKFPTPKGA